MLIPPLTLQAPLTNRFPASPRKQLNGANLQSFLAPGPNNDPSVHYELSLYEAWHRFRSFHRQDEGLARNC